MKRWGRVSPFRKRTLVLAIAILAFVSYFFGSEEARMIQAARKVTNLAEMNEFSAKYRIGPIVIPRQGTYLCTYHAHCGSLYSRDHRFLWEYDSAGTFTSYHRSSLTELFKKELLLTRESRSMALPLE